MNGKFRGPKILKLHECIDWLNNYYSLDIEKKSADNSCLSSNAWLSGFADAEGRFMIAKNDNSVSTTFEISQSHKFLKQHSNQELMQKIANFCYVKLGPKQNGAYRARGSSRTTCNKLIEYFDKYPLLMAKYLDYKGDHCFKNDRSKFALRKTRGNHGIKNDMNKKRTYFNWVIRPFITINNLTDA